MGDMIDRDEAIKVARSLFRLQTLGLYGAAGVGSYGLLTKIAEQAIRALPAASAEDVRAGADVARYREELSLIAVMGFGANAPEHEAIARLAVQRARAALTDGGSNG